MGRTDAEAETPILWPPDSKNWLIWKDPDASKDWKQEEKGTTEDEMVGWHHRLDRHEFEQTLGVGDGQRNLVCCSPWGHKELDMTEKLNWIELIYVISWIKVNEWGICIHVADWLLYSRKLTQHCKTTAAAAAAKSLQSCLTLCNPIDGSPPGSPVHGIFQA